MSLELMTLAYQVIADIAAPNPMQQTAWGAFERQDAYGIGLLLKGNTGSGKTEAIAVPALAHARRLVMVYPTRSLVEDQTERFKRYLAGWSEAAACKGRVITLTVDTGAQSQRYCWQNGCPHSTGDERAGRHLYYGDVIITTLDKFLYRFFGFGEPKKSYIYPLRIRYMNPVVCFDEAHSYESEAFTNFERLTRTLYEKGKDVVLMTATMPEELEACFRPYLETLDFTTGTAGQAMDEWRQRAFPTTPFQPQKRLEYMPADIRREEGALYSPAIERMIQEAEQRSSPGKRLIVTAESVKDAAAIFRRLRRTVQGAPVLLYHGRLSQDQRQTVYEVLKQRDKNSDYVLVSTSAIEVGCDLNAHTLITQLCDPDRLIQRAGRCNRRQEMNDATVVVVGDSVPEWSTALTPDDLTAYLRALQAHRGTNFHAADFIPYIQKRLEADPHIEVMFDMLYEYVYEAHLENKKLHDNGLIITRSWEPSITLYQGERDGQLSEPVTVPVSYCRVPRDQQPVRFDSGGGFFKRTYDPTTHRFTHASLGSRWENAYHNDIVVCLPDYTYADGSSYESELGYVDLPFLFHGPFPRGTKVILEHGVDNDKIAIWYIDPHRVTGRPVEGIVTTPAATPIEDEESPTESSEEDNE